MEKPETVYNGTALRVERYPVGKGRTREYFERVTSPDSVMMIPVLKDGRLLIERQFRHSIGKYLYELPAGRMEAGEDPRQAALRELEEETGYKAGKMKFLFSSYPSPGHDTEVMRVYLATDLAKGKTHKDPNEIISTRAMTAGELLRLIKNGRIPDMKTIAGILLYLSLYGNASKIH